MRIVQVVVSDAFAGVERYLTYIAPALAELDHDVVVIGGDPARMGPVLEPAGVSHVPGSRTIEVARALARIEPPDLVHTHMTAAEVAAAAAWPKLRRPVVTTMHFAQPRGQGGPKATAYRVLEPLFARQIAISEFVGRTAGTGLVVIPNGVPDPGSPPHADDRGPTVLVAQRFESEKDTATAVRAWAASGLAADGWTMDVAGVGVERHDLVRLVSSLDIETSVRFVGRVDDIEARMRSASIFLATAPAEPFGLSVAEAMAAGLAVVAADGGGHRELLHDIDDRQLVPARDPAGFARSLRALADDRPRREALGRANRERYEREYTIDRHVARLDALYREVIAAD